MHVLLLGPKGFGVNNFVLYTLIGKVLSLLEAYFDLILGYSLHIKIQIMGRKITANLGLKSLLRKVKIVLSFFLFVTIFEHLVLQNREYASKPAVFFFNKKSGTKGG